MSMEEVPPNEDASPSTSTASSPTNDGEPTKQTFNRNELTVELENVDESKECIQGLSSLFQSHSDHAGEIVNIWISELRNTQAMSERRLPFLFIANDVIQSESRTRHEKKNQQQEDLSHESNEGNIFTPLFEQHLEEAISLVCNHPSDRESVCRILSVWIDRKIFSTDKVTIWWKATGEDLPYSLQKNAYIRVEELKIQDPDKLFKNTPTATAASEKLQMKDMKRSPIHSSPTNDIGGVSIPHGIASHPILIALDKLDKQQHEIDHLKSILKERMNVEELLELSQQCPNKDSILLRCREQKPFHPKDLRQRVERTIGILKFLKKRAVEWPQLEINVQKVGEEVIKNEEEVAEKLDNRYQLCDDIDIALNDFDQHRKLFGQEWKRQQRLCQDRVRQREEREKKKAKEILEKQKAAVAETVITPTASERAEIEGKRRKSLEKREAIVNPALIEREAKQTADKSLANAAPGGTQVWHPARRELVEIPSSHDQGEIWRDT